MDEFKNGQQVAVVLSEKHQLSENTVEHKAKFLGYHLDHQWADVELETEHDGGTKRLSVPVSVLKAGLVFFALIGVALPSRAQSPTYTTPQTVQITLANSLACTGATQTFVTGQSFGGKTFSNLGQTQHYITIVPSASVISLQAEIDGIDNAGNSFRISDILDTAAIPAVPLTLTGSGYFPKIQISVTCGSAVGTFTMNYSGASSTSNVNAGSYLLAQIDKTLFAGAAANTSKTITIQTPFGSTSGLFNFFSGAGPPAGSSISFICSGTVALSIQSFTLATPGGTQFFTPQTTVCPLMQVTYTSGGASASTYTLEVIFSVPGFPNAADPCQNPAIFKSSVPVSLTTATTTSLVSPSSSARVYVCGASFTIAPSGTIADTIQFITGSGGTCGTGTVTNTGTYGNGDLTTTTGVVPINLQSNGMVFSSAQGAGVCAVTAGTTVNIQGILSFVQQ